jgi:Flp pilus assembly pilin Flp
MKTHSMTTMLFRLLQEESGQDIIEYALLTTFIGLVGVLAWVNIKNGVGNAYAGWGSGVKTLSACTPDPGGGGCP